MVCVYDGKVPNFPPVDGARKPPVRQSLAERLRERIDLLECRLADMADEKDRLASDNETLRRLVQSMELAARCREAARVVAQREAVRDNEALHAVMVVVAAHAGIDLAHLRGSGHARVQSWPRQMAAYLARAEFGLKLSQIAAGLGKDHTTIVHAVAVVGERLAAGCARTTALHRACLPELAAVAARLGCAAGRGGSGFGGPGAVEGSRHGEG